VVIAQVINDLRIGGAERLFVDLVNSLPATKVIVVVIDPEVTEPNFEDRLAPHVELIRLPIRKRTALFAVPRLSQLFRKRSVEVVHTHMFWPNLYGSTAAALAGVPVVVTSEHGMNKWKRRWHRWAEAEIISRVAYRRLCVSRDILARRRDEDGVPDRILCLAPNGTRVPNEATVVSEGPVIIGSVGRLVREKDFPTLIRAVGKLHRQGIRCRLELVGEGPSRSDIEATVREEGVDELVTLAGSQKDVDAWLKRWSVFASSSIQEGQPVALLEAMAHGLPCVATDVGGVSQTLDNGSEGIVVPPDNTDALAAALARLIADPGLRSAFGSKARERVKREFSIDSLAARCMDIYREGMEAGMIQTELR
jgi:glycosyltransferase involved in cell wall biosynthesis